MNLQLLKDLIERKMNFTETSDPIAMGRYAWVCIYGCACVHVSVGVGVFVYIIASMCGCVYVHMLVCVYSLYGCGCDGRSHVCDLFLCYVWWV